MYHDTEICHKVLLGQFASDPYCEWFHFSPAMNREKKMSFKKKVIFDQLQGIHGGVNGGIPEHWHCGEHRRVCLPTAEDMAARIMRLG